MKKILCFLISISMSIAFIASGMLMTAMIIDPSLMQTGLLLSLLLEMCIDILLIETVNIAHDKADGYVSKKQFFGRWVHNCCFITLLFSFAYALIASIASGTINIHNRNVSMLLIICVIASIYLYFRNYRNLMSRRSRIKSIRNRQLRYKDRRYYYLVEEVKEEDSFLTLKGTLNGKIRVNDEVYIYIPAEDSIRTRVHKITSNNQSVSKAKDGTVEICLKKDELTETIHKYSVISSVAEKVEIEQENLAENPFVNGLIMGYGKCNKDPEYMSALLWEISSGQYLMAGKCNEQTDDEITDVIKKNVNAAFPSVSTTTDEKMSILPVFTDWDALHRWKMMMEEKDAMTVIMKFEQIVEIMHAEFDGIVINPFGPFPFYMPRDLANSLLRMHTEAQNEK